MHSYRGRLAPSPSGLLHLGHARTFWTAYQRALAANGTLVLRNEDLDPKRSRREFTEAMLVRRQGKSPEEVVHMATAVAQRNGYF